MMQELTTTMSKYAPITLAEMAGVALLNRTDTKYVLRERELHQVLQRLSKQYRVLSVAGQRLNNYETLYFDTNQYDLYRRHHAGASNRYKVRTREYVDTQLAFLEVKFKTNRNRTIKSRLQIPELVTQLGEETAVFIQTHSPLSADHLRPKLWNNFTRITLVSMCRPERLTIDINLAFQSDVSFVSLPGVVIAEVKQEGYSRHSDFIQQMRRLSIRPSGFSKYCIGTSLLNPTLKNNNFKPNLRRLHKLMQQPWQ